MTTMTPAPLADNYHQLLPRNGDLYAVRWVRRDGRDVRHRYFRRHADAMAFAHKLWSYGRRPRIYSTDTTWSEVPR